MAVRQHMLATAAYSTVSASAGQGSFAVGQDQIIHLFKNLDGIENK